MKTTKSIKQSTCYHCGEACLNDYLFLAERSFCCLGCKTIYELLEENELCTYYDLQSNPGNQLKHYFSEKFNFLENEEISDRLLDFKSDDYCKVTFYIPSIHCSSCIWLLENIKRFDDGITHSRIQFSTKKVTIDFHPNTTSLKEIALQLAQLGYEPEITLNQEKNSPLNTHKTNYIKLGVAGFAFGNIMLLYFPEYLGLRLDEEFKNTFYLISLVLSLSSLYCGNEFFLSAYAGLRKKILNIDLPIAIGILTLLIRSVYDILTFTGAGYLDSLSGLVFFLLIGRWFQNQTYSGMSFERNYKSYFPLAVYRTRNNERKSVMVEDIEINDVLEIHNEEILPCDAILKSISAYIDYSFVTGESKPVQVKEGDKVFAGGRVKGNMTEFIVIREVSNSYLTGLWNKTQMNEAKTISSQQLIDQVSRYFTPTILFVAFIAGVFWQYYDASKVWFVISAVLIIACPCALAMATPFTLGTTMNLLGKSQFYLKNTQIIEQFWKIKSIIFDKTGTLTQHESHVIFDGIPLNLQEKNWVLTLAGSSTHPLSQSIYEHLKTPNCRSSIANFLEKAGMGIEGTVDNHVIRMGSANWIEGQKVTNDLAFGSKVYLSIDGQQRGCFTIEKKYRDGLQEMINQLRTKYQFTVLSGDNDLEKVKLEHIFPKSTAYHFHQSPTDKLAFVEGINEPTIMIGDGLNDAGALRASTIGISITEKLSAFTPASEVIMLGSVINKLPTFLALIYASKKIILAGITLSFIYNILGLTMAVMGLITPIFAAILMPISSVSVVIFSTLGVRLTYRKILNHS